MRQVAGFVWRDQLVWAVLFVLLFFGRSAYDVLIPTAAFRTRVLTTAWLLVVLWAAVGTAAVWRTRMFRSGLLAGAMMSIMAAALSSVGTLMLYAGSALAPGSLLLGTMGQMGRVDEILLMPFVFAPVAIVLAGSAGVASGLAQLLVHRLAAADVVGLPRNR